MTRRELLHDGVLVLAGAAVGEECLAQAAVLDPARKPAVQIGLLADVHYADKDPGGTRHYRDSLAKMRRAVSQLNAVGVDFAVELGDFIDSANGSVEAELTHLKAIEAEFTKLEQAERHYVLGNHCVHTLTKREFVENCGARAPHYSFDRAGFHFVVLDACYRGDGEPYEHGNFDWRDANIPRAELEWLAADLARANHPTIAFTHQRLDDAEHYSVKNAGQVRELLERSGNVLAVFQGHSHQSTHIELNGINYCVLRAMVEGPGVENNGFANVQVFPDGSILVRGFGRRESYQHGRPA